MVFITFYGIICDTFCKFSWEVFPDAIEATTPLLGVSMVPQYC